jgi:hypothetical protein
MALRSIAGPEDPGERREPVVGAAALARALEVQEKNGALAGRE